MEVVLAAAVTAAGAAFVAWGQRKSAKEMLLLKAAIGTPNGKGNVVQMNEEQIRRMDRLEQRFDSHLEWHVRH